MSRLVTIARFYDMPAALCAKSALDGYGIPCVLQNDALVRLNWHWILMVQGIKLHTFEEHYEEALELFAACQAEPCIETPVAAFKRHSVLGLLLAFCTILPFGIMVPFWMRKRKWLVKSSQ